MLDTENTNEKQVVKKCVDVVLWGVV